MEPTYEDHKLDMFWTRSDKMEAELVSQDDTCNKLSVWTPLLHLIKFNYANIFNLFLLQMSFFYTRDAHWTTKMEL